jgi:hypothetical protein
VGFESDSAPRSENENRRHLAVDGWWCRNGEVPIAGDLRPRTEAYQSTTVSGSGWVSARGSASDRRRRPPRSRSRPSVPGHGFGPERCGVPGTPRHRPAVAFGARRASAPARRPAVARGVCPARVISATSGRLDGLLGGCDALLRYAIPEGAPLENVPLPASEGHRHILKDGTPAGSRILVLSGARDSRAPGCTRRGETVTWVARGPWRGARRPPVALRPDAGRDFSAAPGSATRACGGPRSAAALLGPFLRFTGLPSRSALVAPPLRLAALRWRERPVLLE